MLLAYTLFAATGATSAASKGNGKGKPAIALMLKSGSELCAVQAKVKRAPKRSRAKFQANSDGRWKPRLARRIESGNSRFEVGCAEFGLTPGPH